MASFFKSLHLPSLSSLPGLPFLSSYVGVDIGTTSIKAVEITKADPRPRLINYALLESQGSLLRTNTAFQTSALKLFEQEIANFLKILVEKFQPRTRNAVASLPLFSSFTTILSLPDMSRDELEKAITFQARQYLPMPISEVALDWSKVSEYEDDKGFKYVQVLLVSVPLEHIKKYQRIFKAAGLTLTALEVEGLSLVRGLIGIDQTPTCIVDIGGRSTNIIIADQGQPKFMSQSDFASAALTQALASALSINPLRAEELKCERGIIGTGPNYELSTIMLPFLDAIISEVKRVDFSYKSQFPSARKIERVILSGGGANLLGIQKYFEGQLGIPTVKAHPIAQFSYDSAIEPIVPALSSEMSVALGAALRQF
ncbi:MAG: type IV pilus assembly protein PilM [bacterium]|nr:type IV pilus assembly protein PilM [bacterium]